VTKGVMVLAAMASVNAVAQTNLPSDAELRNQLQKVNLQMQQLQQQVQRLQTALAQKESAHKSHKQAKQHTAVKKPGAQTSPHRIKMPKKATGPLWVKVGHRELYADDPLKRLHYGDTVVTSPFIGLQTTYLPFDLLHWQPSMNEDLVLLRDRSRLQQMMDEHNIAFDRPILQLSGAVEALWYNANGFYVGQNNPTIALGNVELDMNAAVSRWATGFASFNYNTQPVATGSRDPAGTVFIKRGFLTIGNLNKTPFYFSLGEMYPPFGRYSSAMVTTPLTTSTGRILTAAAVFGYFKNGFNASIYGYDGDMQYAGGDAAFQGGLNLSYTQQIKEKNNFNVGLGAITNMGDTQGLQNNRIPAFPPGTAGSAAQTNFSGFATNPNGNVLAHRVPAGDLNAMLTLGHWTFIGEYLSAFETFSTANLTFNGGGAVPSAMQAEVDYTTKLWNRPFIFGASYGHTWEALAMNLPEQSISLFANTSIWKDTLASFEYRHDFDYPTSAFATGDGVPRGVGPGLSGTAQGRNSVVLQLGVYF